MSLLDTSFVGKEVEIGTFTVSAEEIKEFAQAIGDPNPLYFDVSCAQRAGYPHIIAPPTFCLRLRGGRMLPEVPLKPGLVGLHAGQEIEFYDEIYAGQTYTVRARVTSMYEKTGRSGPMGFVVREVEVKDKEGKKVVLLRERQIVRSPEKRL